MNRFLPAILLLLLFLVSGCDRPSPVAPGGGVAKVGFIGPFQGPDLALGQDTLEGVLAAQAILPQLNNGKRIEVIAEDSGNDPAVTRRAMQKLVQEDGVSVLLLGLDSESLLEMLHFVESLQTPAFALIATHPGIVSGSAYINQLCFDDDMQGEVAALFVRDELLIKGAAVIVDPGDPHSKYLQAAFEKKFSDTGGVLTGSYAVTEIDEVLLHHLQAQKTELLYLPASAQTVLRVQSTLEEIDWSPEIMAGDGLLASVLSKFPEQAGDIEGIYATDLFSDRGDFVRHRRLGRAAEASFDDLFDGEENTFTDLGVEGYAIAVHAMNQCLPAMDRQCINTAIRSTENFEGIMAKISIDTNGRATRPVYVNTIKNGFLDSVVKVY
ncbi:MAG: ABC transporter substrate-binding protein [Gammaproteobacteria bacterium]|nr:MAG: ABC transporter substrate-binding protein [Gammaproteobacteria bacterium]